MSRGNKLTTLFHLGCSLKLSVILFDRKLRPKFRLFLGYKTSYSIVGIIYIEQTYRILTSGLELCLCLLFSEYIFFICIKLKVKIIWVRREKLFNTDVSVKLGKSIIITRIYNKILWNRQLLTKLPRVKNIEDFYILLAV